jgi:sporulation protein YlmC with PRC-barrel domain
MSDSTTSDPVPDSHYLYPQGSRPTRDEIEDFRWKQLIGSDGEKIGTIDELISDEDDGRVEFLQISHGGFLGIGAEHFLVPVSSITGFDDKHVYIDRNVDGLNGVPPVEFDRIEDPDYYEGIRSWWGTRDE